MGSRKQYKTPPSRRRGAFTRANDLTDEELIASAWREVRRRPETITTKGCTRAKFASKCPRCEKPIAAGQEIHRVTSFTCYVHLRCRRPSEVLEGGKPHTVTVRRISKVPTVCRQCNTEHAGPCW